MGFVLRVNGEPVKEFTGQVIKVSMHTARGEAGSIGISTEGVVDIRVEEVASGGNLRLDQLEAASARFRNEIVSELATGTPPPVSDPTMSARQAIQDDTLRPGGPNPELNQQIGAHPALDLAQGLDPNSPSYTADLTRRIESFNTSQNSESAIRDNPAGSSVVVEPEPETQTEPETQSNGFALNK